MRSLIRRGAVAAVVVAIAPILPIVTTGAQPVEAFCVSSDTATNTSPDTCIYPPDPGGLIAPPGPTCDDYSGGTRGASGAIAWYTVCPSGDDALAASTGQGSPAADTDLAPVNTSGTDYTAPNETCVANSQPGKVLPKKVATITDPGTTDLTYSLQYQVFPYEFPKARLVNGAYTVQYMFCATGGSTSQNSTWQAQTGIAMTYEDSTTTTKIGGNYLNAATPSNINVNLGFTTGAGAGVNGSGASIRRTTTGGLKALRRHRTSGSTSRGTTPTRSTGIGTAPARSASTRARRTMRGRSWTVSTSFQCRLRAQQRGRTRSRCRSGSS